MRSLFFQELTHLMRTDDSLFFLTGDTGFNLVEPLFDEFPERTLNVGVAEQNMIGIASGLVNVGFLPVCYAITNFLVERCFEQIRNDICLHEYKIILVGTSTGYDNGALGATHHKLDDIGALKVLPNLRIYSPSGNRSVSAILKEVLREEHASFIRITKKGIDEKSEIEGPNHFICEADSKVLVISHGKMIGNALQAYRTSPVFSLYAMDRIKPLSHSILNNLLNRFDTIVVIEDNFRSGLFNSLCQWMVENGVYHKKMIPIAPKNSYDRLVGSQNYLEDKHGLSPQKINTRICKIMEDY